MDTHTRELLGISKNKISRLEKLTSSRDIYDALESAGLMRDLLLSDGQGLFGLLLKAQTATSNRRNKRSRGLTFLVKHEGVSVLQSGLQTKQFKESRNSEYCTHPVLAGTIEYKRDQFLGLPVLCIKGDHYTCRDMIQFASNKLGSRHFDRESGTEQQVILHEIRERFGATDFDPVISILREKAPIVVRTGKLLIARVERGFAEAS